MDNVYTIFMKDFKNVLNHASVGCWLWHCLESQLDFSLRCLGSELTQKIIAIDYANSISKKQGLCNCMADDFRALNLAFWFVKISWIFECLWQNSHILIVLEGRREGSKEGRKEERKKEERKLKGPSGIGLFLPSVLLVYCEFPHPCHSPRMMVSPDWMFPLACQVFLTKCL